MAYKPIKYNIHTGVKKIRTRLAIAAAALALGGSGLSLSLTVLGIAKASPACVPTGFVRDSINLTAARIGGNIKGTVDATGCNIGVYFNKQHPGSVGNANIYGANYFGVVVDGGHGSVKVNIQHSSIHEIGETPFNGTQHGNAIYYYSDDSSGNVSGQVTQNHIYDYQKGGIIINGDKTKVPVSHNTVNGLGPVNFIAQNGIQVSRGASGNVTQNTVTGNSYTGPNSASSAGILIYGGWGAPLVKNITVSQNTLIGNDVGLYVAEYNDDASAGPSTPTKISVSQNTISNDAVNNTTGYGSQGYQAGISDSGNKDKITHNIISGDGYAPRDDATAFDLPIDVTPPYSINPSLSLNTFNGHQYNP